MKDITIVSGVKENIIEDVHIITGGIAENQEIVVATGNDIKRVVIEKSSALFIENNLVLVVLDPSYEVLNEIKEHLTALKSKIHVVIYYTTSSGNKDIPIEGKAVTPSKDKEKRIKERVLNLVKQNNKVMTDKAFNTLKEMIKDESILDSELIKLINYVGDRKEIKSRDVMAIVTQTHEENLLELFDAMSRMDTKQTLNIFENLLTNGLPVLAIHGFLVKQIRLILQTKDMEEVFRANMEYSAFSKIFSKLKDDIDLKPMEKKHYLPYQKPYYAYNLSKTGSKLKTKNLIAFYDMLTSLEISIKSGTKHDRIHLEHGLLGV